MKTYAEMTAELEQLAAHNDRLTAGLRSARAQIVELKSDLERVGDPPNSYATYLRRCEGTTIDVLHHGRRLRVATAASLDLDSLTPGAELRLNESLAAVEAVPPSDAGNVVPVVEALADSRLLVAVAPDDTRVLRRAGSLTTEQLHPGDHVLVDLKSQLVLERIDRAEITDLVLEQVPDVAFDQIGGLGEQIEAIRDAVELPFLQQDLYRTYGLRPPQGVLLYGPPGCGKTMIAKAVAHELVLRSAEVRGVSVAEALENSAFLNVKGPELLNKYVGETERSIRLVFERAREKAAADHPVVIFFDEMEALFRTRGTGMSTDVETTIVPQLLAEIDGVEGLDNVIVIGASNREDMIDPAILRPGRLDVKIRVRRPNLRAGREILGLYLDDAVPVREDREELLDLAAREIYDESPASAFVRVEYSDGGSDTLHFRDFVSGATLRNIVDRAKKLAVKDQLATGEVGVAAQHLRDAITTEFVENEDMPSAAHPEDWARVSGLPGGGRRRVDAVVPLQGRTLTTPDIAGTAAAGEDGATA